jgi:hypothetical protein
MHNERLKCPGRAFDNRLTPFHKIQNINASIGMMQDFSRKPMPPGFDKFLFM